MKRRRYSDPQALSQWRAEQEYRCAACWRTEGIVLDIHHLLGGPWGRPDIPAALLLLCRGCHGRLQDGHDKMAVCFLLKAELGQYDRAALKAHCQKFVGPKRKGAMILPAVARRLPSWIIEARGRTPERKWQ